MGKYLDATGLSHLMGLIKSKLMPSGGASGQVLMKSSGTDYDAAWANIVNPSTVSYTKQTVTISSANWSGNSCTKSVTGVTTTNDVIVSPAATSAEAYAAAGVLCTAQGNGTLTFTCVTTPSSSITVNVMVMQMNLQNVNGVSF